MMIITSMLLFYSLASPENRANIIGHMYPLIIEFLLIIGVVWAYVEVIRNIYQYRCQEQEPKN